MIPVDCPRTYLCREWVSACSGWWRPGTLLSSLFWPDLSVSATSPPVSPAIDLTGVPKVLRPASCGHTPVVVSCLVALVNHSGARSGGPRHFPGEPPFGFLGGRARPLSQVSFSPLSLSLYSLPVILLTSPQRDTDGSRTANARGPVTTVPPPPYKSPPSRRSLGRPQRSYSTTSTRIRHPPTPPPTTPN